MIQHDDRNQAAPAIASLDFFSDQELCRGVAADSQMENETDEACMVKFDDKSKLEGQPCRVPVREFFVLYIYIVLLCEDRGREIMFNDVVYSGFEKLNVVGQ